MDTLNYFLVQNILKLTFRNSYLPSSFILLNEKDSLKKIQQSWKYPGSSRFYLNFPTGKLFGKLSFLQNFSGEGGTQLWNIGILHFNKKRSF